MQLPLSLLFPSTPEERAERRRRIRHAVLAGARVADVALAFAVSPAVIYKALTRNELRQAAELRRRQRYQALAALVAGGMPAPEAARRAGVSLPMVYQACRMQGITLPHLGRRSVVPPSRWLEVDWTWRDIDLARQLGVSKERVRQKRMALGMPKVSRGKKR